MDRRKAVRVFAPATVANISCAFDVMGLSLESPGDEVTATWTPSKGVIIKTISGDDGALPLDAEKNSAGVSSLALLQATDAQFGVELELRKMMPMGSGLGSSSASAVAAVVAVNELLDAPLSRKELVQFAMAGEKIACGAAHADNVAPALLGGITLIRSYEPLEIIQLPCPDSLYCGVIYPEIEVRTSDSRSILPKTISFQQATSHFGNIGAFVFGLTTNDLELIGRAVQDYIVEPSRRDLIPGFDEIKSAILSSGALACGISGSGPSMFHFGISRDSVDQSNLIAEKIWGGKNIASRKYSGKINRSGARIISEAQ